MKPILIYPDELVEFMQHSLENPMTVQAVELNPLQDYKICEETTFGTRFETYFELDFNLNDSALDKWFFLIKFNKRFVLKIGFEKYLPFELWQFSLHENNKGITFSIPDLDYHHFPNEFQKPFEGIASGGKFIFDGDANRISNSFFLENQITTGQHSDGIYAEETISLFFNNDNKIKDYDSRDEMLRIWASYSGAHDSDLKIQDISLHICYRFAPKSIFERKQQLLNKGRPLMIIEEIDEQ